MKRTPPPPPNTKKTTKAPPPPTRIIQQFKDQTEKSSNFLSNNLDQQQQRPQVQSERNQTSNPNFYEQNLTKKNENAQFKQTSQGQIELQLQKSEDNFNKEGNIIPQQTNSISNRQQQMNFEKKQIPPKIFAANTNRKTSGPPPPKSKGPPPIKSQQIKQVQKYQNEHQSIESVETKEENKNNHLQEKPLQPQQVQADKNETQSSKVETTIPKSNCPPPPKTNPNNRITPQPPKHKIFQKLKTQIPESPKAQNYQENISNNIQLINTVNKPIELQRQHIQHIFPQKVAEQIETQKQNISKQRGSQINVQKPAQKSKLQQKLQQLRKAKQQMTQQYDEERVQAEIDQINEQNTKESNPILNNHNDIQSDKVDVVQHPIINEVQINQQPVDSHQIVKNNSTYNQSNKVQIQKGQIKVPQLQNQETRPKLVNKKSPPPPTSKGKSAVPPPIIRSSPRTAVKQIPHQTTTTQTKAQFIEEKFQPLFIQHLQQRQNKPQKKLQQTSVFISNKPEIKKIEVEIPKRVQSPVSIEMNKLLERYHNLKSTYVSNIHQLEELVNFTKKQQQAQIQKINKLLYQLNRKNQQIKEVCGLKTEDHLEEIPTYQENLPV